MPRAGAVWVDVLPNMSGFGRTLDQQIGEPVARATARAGAEGGDSMLASMGGKLKAGGAAVGLALGATIAKGTQLAMEKQASKGKLAAQLGLDPKAAQRAGNAAGQLYANGVTESIEDGAAAVRAIMSAGLAPEGATTKQLGNIATKAQDLSSLFEVDLGQAANAAGQAVKTGLAKNATEAFDTMTRGFQVMGPRADDLMDTFNEYGTIFRALNLPIKTVTGLLSQGMAAGARDTDVVADALKEFQIRATDGSTASAAGFKALGLNAKTMTAQIAAGGQGASDGLQTVLDKLRGMDDPVDRNAAAVALFGTKAEDMGKALYALDPSKAVADLGKVGGAAKKAGDNLRDNAGMQFETFKRRALMAVGDVSAKYLLPALVKIGTFLNRDVLPPVKSAAGVLQRNLGPAIGAVASAIASGASWFKTYGAWLAPLALIVGGLTLALNANAIATSLAMGVMGAYSLAVRGVMAVTRAWAAAQALFNAVMALNPITLVVIGLVALGAALVVAYQKSATFRAIVQGAWAAIQTAAMAAWTGFLKPALDGLMAGLRAVGSAASWLWTSVLSPVFGFIGTAARILATIVTVIVVGPIILAVKALGAVFGWLWSNAISPVIGFIVGGFKLWWAGVRLYLNLGKSALRAVGSAAMWLWRSAISPVIGWIVGGFKLWWAGVKLYLNYGKSALRALGAVGMWLWKNALSPAFHGIASVAKWLYDKGIKPPIDLGKRAAKALASAFKDAKDMIGEQFGKLKNLAKAPISFIVDVVYNKGLRGVWNAVAGAFGAPKLPKFKGFASGGILPGYTPGRDVHRFVSPTGGGLDLSGGESIMRPEFTRGVGSGFVNYFNKLAQSGGARGVRQAMAPMLGGQPQQAFAGGGIFGWIGKKVAGAGSAAWDKIKSGASWLKDTLGASARAGVNNVVKPLLKNFPGADTGFGKMLVGIPDRMIDALFGYADKADKKGASTSGGKGVKDALTWARSQNGKAYQWGGNGNPSWDCSGFMSAIESVIRGQSPHRRWATGSFSGATAAPGWVRGKKAPFMIGITNAGVGHTAGTLNGTNVESRGGDGVVVGPRARSYRDQLFTDWYGFAGKGYADGGKPRAGEVAWVGERGPELVRFRGGEEVYNHRDSMRMAEGWGARGFAKGTAAAKARKDIPGDLTAFTKSLTGSASAIAKATNELTKDLRAAGGAGKSLAKSTAKASAKLQSMAKQRDAITSKIATAKQAATDQKTTAKDYLGLSNLAEATSIGDVIGGLQSRQGTLKSFQGQVKALSKKGLNQTLIQQLVAMGPDSTLAGIISAASPGQIKQLNALATSGAKLTTSYGNTMADAMYDAGKAASKGFLTGLMADEKALQKAMAKIGAGAVKAIRSKKGIDAHSPSRKGAEAGKDLGAGLVAGMAAAAPAVTSAAERLGAGAVPSVVPVTSGSTGQASSLDGRPLYLVVEDGTVLRAYVDDRVDEGLGDVRRASRAGSKKK